MLLLTGANGRTGRPLLEALKRHGAQVRVFVRDADKGEQLRALGADEVAVGDMLDDEAVGAAVEGCAQVLHVGPPMHADEVAITDSFLEASRRTGVEQFIYYSVMHPVRREVRHHRLKLDATERVIESGVPYTLIEPIRYMQHLEPIWSQVLETGVHQMPFSVDVTFGVVDLLDLAEATALAATQGNHLYATYELAGPQNLSQRDMARIISEVIGREVVAREVPLDEMAAGARAKGFGEDRIEQMRIMNAHYDAHGFLGNSNVLTYLLNRQPTTFRAYVERLAG